jgi:Protein of unknown function (DUF1826)
MTLLLEPQVPEVSGLGLAADGRQWSMIDDLDLSLVVEPRVLHAHAFGLDDLLALAPFERVGTGTPRAACEALGPIAPELAEDIMALAARFAAVMGVTQVRIRLEAITTNACRKIHADCTDVRLITTYAGHGTQVVPPGQEAIEQNLWSMPPGWIGLFKGRDFAVGHLPCLHRSPPVGDLGERRLVLVIDTPQFPTQHTAG